MYHKQLVTHVTTKISEGVLREKIQEELIADGWSEDDIKEAFYYSAYPEKLRHFSFIRTLHSEVPTAVTITLIALVVVIFATSFFFFRNKTLSYNINLPTVHEPNQVAFSYGEQPELSNPDFFGKVKQQFIDGKASFIEADLSAMILRVYKDGNLSLEVPINSKGREGSWWETPAGLYKISSKEDKHFAGHRAVTFSR
jgi:hypothetical protein